MVMQVHIPNNIVQAEMWWSLCLYAVQITDMELFIWMEQCEQLYKYFDFFF
jgi:hypothetical protein